jgi:hypothetical protein
MRMPDGGGRARSTTWRRFTSACGRVRRYLEISSGATSRFPLLNAAMLTVAVNSPVALEKVGEGSNFGVFCPLHRLLFLAKGPT